MLKRMRKKLTRLSLFGAVGGAVVYFLDPRSGQDRRARAKAKFQAKLGGSGDQPGWAQPAADDHGQAGGEQKADGFTPTTAESSGEPPADDKTLVDKIKSEILGRTDYVDQEVVIDAADGVVALRGQLERPEQIDDLAAAVAAVPGVTRVENYLHLPGTPAPNKQDSLEG